MADQADDRAEQVASRVIQARLRELFEERYRGTPPYTEIAREMATRGHRVTAEGLRKLLVAPRINPTATTLRALAAFFGVPAGYLLGDDEPDTASREARVMARSFDRLQTPGARRSLAKIIDEFLQLEEAARDNGSDRTPPTR
ncbi:hypothetical protein [Micromonospora sp. WMMD980]|uniref:hypothetical protein n=1 Tax=Micromonospora sp. WMMD980 TaxID=3016088 RepID=UPI0024171664|nr:hypothetical protein [Micromonospora sp. WMMD980]MDG4803596.1 hypothetical protein [Micromonospora sp. WMMD980]